MRKKQKQFIKECIQTVIDGAVDFRFSLIESSINAQSKEIERVITRETMNGETVNNMFESLSRKNATLESQICCGVKTGHCLTIQDVYTDSSCRFHCIKCGLEYAKDKEKLNKREQDLLKTVLQN